jgi:hypothetical protein
MLWQDVVVVGDCARATAAKKSVGVYLMANFNSVQVLQLEHKKWEKRSGRASQELKLPEREKQQPPRASYEPATTDI